MSKLSASLQILSTYIIYGVVFLLPIFFTPLTSEFFETGKLLLLASAVLILLLIWGVRIVGENKISVVKTPLDLFLIGLAVVAVLSTVFSPAPYLSLFGNLPQVSGSLIAILAVILLYFLAVSTIREVREVGVISSLLVSSGLILSLVTLSSYFKLFLPFDFAQFTNFSPAGSPISGALFLAVIFPLALNLALKEKLERINPLGMLGWLGVLGFSATIILTGNFASWLGLIFGSGLILYKYLAHLGGEGMRLHLRGVYPILGVLGFIALLGLALAVLSYTPTLRDKTELGTLSQSFRKEPNLPFPISWKVSASAFRDSPVLGTGPSTYSFNFTQYKPIEFNATQVWNLRFSKAFNLPLEIWAELGGLGVLFLVLIWAITAYVAIRHFHAPPAGGLSIPTLTFLLLSLLFPVSILTLSLGFLLIALLMGVTKGKELTVNLVGLSGEKHFLIPTLIFIPMILIFGFGFYFLSKLTLGEYHHRAALNSLTKNQGLNAYNFLVQAEQTNPQVPLYRVDLAQTNFALANSIASAKGPTEASPGGSLTDADRVNIQQLLSQSIAEARVATQLAPRSAGNWEVLALIYRQIQGVATNGLQFSLDSYGRAIARDPLNPLLRLAVGGVYYQVKNYDLAVRFFDDAVSLKPDFGNALYNLAIALREKGNLQEAVIVSERLVALLQDKPESQDYQVASDLLKELRDKLPAQAQPTVSTPSGALEQKNLPKVLDLPKPESIATPPAVKR